MNKLSYNLTELMKELQAAKALFSKGKNRGGEAHLFMNRASTSGTKSFRCNKSRKGSTPPQRPNKPLVAKVDKSADRCNHCNRLGHWQCNCPKYLKEVKDKKCKGTLFVTQACLVTDSINSSIVDSGATNYICCSL